MIHRGEAAFLLFMACVWLAWWRLYSNDKGRWDAAKRWLWDAVYGDNWLQPVVPAAHRPEPTVGETWVLRDDEDGNPFDMPPRVQAQILEIKQGWVKYYVNPMFPVNAKRISAFMAIYTKRGE